VRGAALDAKQTVHDHTLSSPGGATSILATISFGMLQAFILLESIQETQMTVISPVAARSLVSSVSLRI